MSRKKVVLLIGVVIVIIALIMPSNKNQIWINKLVRSLEAEDNETVTELLSVKGYDINKEGGGLPVFKWISGEFMDRTPLKQALDTDIEMIPSILEYGADPNYGCEYWDYYEDYPVTWVVIYRSNDDWDAACRAIDSLIDHGVVLESDIYSALISIACVEPYTYEGDEEVYLYTRIIG